MSMTSGSSSTTTTLAPATSSSSSSLSLLSAAPAVGAGSSSGGSGSGGDDGGVIMMRMMSGTREEQEPSAFASKIAAAWNRLTSSLQESALFYVENQKLLDQDKLRQQLIAFPWRKLLIALLPFLAYLVMFKNYVPFRRITGLDKTAQPNLEFLPWLEQAVFQCLPHRILARFANPVFDILAAIPYLIHFPLPFLFIIYLYVTPRRRKDVFSFIWVFGWVNLISVCFQFFFPTAPPWFYDTAVFDSNGVLIDVGPAEAGFTRVDRMLHFPLFHTLYSQSPLKFGAFPSLHVGWPTVILACGPWFSHRVGVLHVIWIVWASMYSNHHYGVDGLLGILIVAFVSVVSTRVWSPFRKYTLDASPRSLLVYSRANSDFSAPAASGSSPQPYKDHLSLHMQ